MQAKPVENYALAFAGIRVSYSNDSAAATNYSVLHEDWGNHPSPPETTTASSWKTGGPPHLTGSIVLGLLLSLFVVFALAGNLLVIVAITTHPHLLHTPNYFLSSLPIP